MQIENTGPLSASEMDQHARRLIPVLHGYSRQWFRRYNGVVEFEEIFSAGLEALNSQLLYYRHEGGCSVDTLCKRWIFKACGAACRSETRKRRGIVEWDVSESGRMVDHGGSREMSQNRREDFCRGRKAASMAHEVLDPEDHRIFSMLFFNGMTQKEVGSVIGVTHQSVSASKDRILRKLKSALLLSNSLD